MVRNNMTARAVLPLLFVCLILTARCKNQEVQSHWSVEPVRVDGQMTDWAGVPTTYFEDSGVQLGLCNDAKNLYVLFSFNDPNWARAIRMGGLTLWLDNSAKKKKDFGLRYTGGPPPSEMQKPGMAGEGGFWDRLTPEQKQRLMQRQAAMADQITVIDKKMDQAITLPSDSSRGPAVSFGTPQGIYTYEFRIPLQEKDKGYYAIGAQPGQTISLGLEWGGIEMRDRQQMMRERGGGMMGGGPPGGRMGGGRGGSRGGPPMQPLEKQEVWVKTLLASPPAGQ